MSKNSLFYAFVSVLFFANHNFSQIESGKIVPSAEKTESKEKKEKVKTPKEKKEKIEEDMTGKSFLFIGGGAQFTQPLNSETNNLFSEPLGFKKREKGMVTPVFNINYKISVNKGFYVNFGFDYSQTAEKYNWKSPTTDSAYNYINKYQLLSVPVGITYITGKKIQFTGGLGLAPQVIFGSKNTLTTVTEKKVETTTKTPLRNAVNDFNIMAYIQAGVQFRITNGLYFYLLPEFRYSLFNTLNKQASYARKYWTAGAQIGFSFNF